MKEKPFIHLFKTSKAYYLYDVNTDQILDIPKRIYFLLKNENYEDSYIEKLIEYGYLKSCHVEKTEHPYTEYLEYYFNNRMNSLVLQLTQNCNLRCNYCVYSGNYMNRNHNKTTMSFEVAKKGIDFLATHSSDSTNFNISFYGGEPLLEISLIKKCMEYCEQRLNGKEIFYNITTNGTLLNEDIVSFFQEYDVAIMISLDGPESVHDEFRKFANSDLGSHRIVLKKVSMIKEKFPEYFKKNVTFNTVLNSERGFDEINKYFLNEDILKGAKFTSSLINNNYSLCKNGVTEKFTSEIQYATFLMYLKELGFIKNYKVSPLLDSRYLELKNFKSSNGYYRNRLPQKSHHGGPCIPGLFHTFLTIDGNLYPCERVSELSEVARIGNIDKGVDLKKVEKLLNLERMTEDECHSCWAYDYCKICIAFCDKLTDISKEMILEQCHNIRSRVENLMKDYCLYSQLGYDFQLESNEKVIKGEKIYEE